MSTAEIADQAAESPFLRGSQIFSISGQIEEVVAEAMLQEHPTLCRRIPLAEFPDATMCPDLHVDAQGRPAKFAILMPTQLVREFEDRIARLRS